MCLINWGGGEKMEKKSSELTLEVRSHSKTKLLENHPNYSPMLVLIFGGKIPCVFCL